MHCICCAFTAIIRENKFGPHTYVNVIGNVALRSRVVHRARSCCACTTCSENKTKTVCAAEKKSGHRPVTQRLCQMSHGLVQIGIKGAVIRPEMHTSALYNTCIIVFKLSKVKMRRAQRLNPQFLRDAKLKRGRKTGTPNKKSVLLFSFFFFPSTLSQKRHKVIRLHSRHTSPASLTTVCTHAQSDIPFFTPFHNNALDAFLSVVACC